LSITSQNTQQIKTNDKNTMAYAQTKEYTG